ncbi:MAG TPA: LacI family DNA-binding transcriptional regulator [Terriglobales bacterium]|nr:LacI family DNA-binding transcriptional regulator [Terriglobales bacterium]
MQKRPKKIKLSDVARAAQVSTATVSRFVTARGGINPQTRDRIIQAAIRLGFDLERGRKSRIIVFLLSNRSVLHPFHSAVLMGAQAYCAEHDYAMLFLPFHYSTSAPVSEVSIPEILYRPKIVSGVIVAGANSQSLLQLLSEKSVPWVALGNNVIANQDEELTGGQAVYFDDISGAYELTQYLQSLGHRRIAFVGNLNLPWYARRYRGYERAMREAGLKTLANERNFREGEEMGYIAVKAILHQPDPPTAIFAGDDTAARGVYKAARDRGMEIPDDLSVAGFNDTPEASALHPALTSVRVFTDDLGKQLAEALLEQIARPDLQPQHMKLPTQLIRRESCAPLIATENRVSQAIQAETR